MEEDKLNSKPLIWYDAGNFTDIYDPEIIAKRIVDELLPQDITPIFFVKFTNAGEYKLIVQKYKDNDYASFIMLSYANENLIFIRKYAGEWKEKKVTANA